ncbi:hypothetical protein [Nocardia sp. CA-120079]|uniref:hypothetical protein n=1 Tax=Nocardia sp. CA-120079 TaxID=3239974 RepID=UPI003D99CFF2
MSSTRNRHRLDEYVHDGVVAVCGRAISPTALASHVCAMMPAAASAAISEGVLVYLEQPQVRRALTLIAENFPRAELATDTTGRWMIDHQDRHDALKQVSARMRWACDDPAFRCTARRSRRRIAGLRRRA